MDTETIHQVNRLIYYGLAYSNGFKRLIMNNQTEIRELVQRFQAQEEFRTLVEEGLKALELQHLALEDNGLRLSARNSNSLFACTVTDYGKLLARTDLKAAEILCVHCAAATAFFPMEADLDAPVEDLGVVLASDVIEILRRFSRIEFDPEEEDDPLHPELRTVARRMRELPEENPDSIRGGSGNSWLELTERIFEHMTATGYLLRFEDAPGEWEYRPTPIYQAAIREGTVYTFHEFRDRVKQPGIS